MSNKILDYRIKIMTNRKRRTLKRNYFTNIVFMMFLILIPFSITRAESWKWIEQIHRIISLLLMLVM